MSTVVEEKTVYRIWERNLSDFQARIEKLNKRAAKLEVAPIVLAIGTPTRLLRAYRRSDSTAARCWLTQEQYDSTPDTWKLTGEVTNLYPVEVHGEAPHYAGWTFLATLEPIDADGTTVNLVLEVPGEHCPDEYRATVGNCDHCQTKRNRKQTFVVRHDDGTTKVVGRQCLRDFLGHTDPYRLASWAELMCELGSLCDAAEGEVWGSGVYCQSAWSLDYFLTWTASAVAHEGWLSRTAVYESGFGQSTADFVLYLLQPPSSAYAEAYRAWTDESDRCQPTDANRQEALAAIDWAKELSEDDKAGNNYLANINAIARAGIVNRKTSGLAASIVAAYAKARDAELKRQRYAARPVSEFVGTVGKRQELDVIVDRIIPIETNWGVTNLCRMHDTAGNDVICFASGSAELEEGHGYRIKATVKKHDEYKGRKQTTVNRAVVVVGLLIAD